jgi:hypothetical protein
MLAPYVVKLNSEIEQSVDEVERARLECYLAFYWARSGELDRAEAIRDRLRAKYGTGNYPRLSILIMCAEALIHYFRDQSPESLDRMRRAHLLSSAMRDNELIALTSAWLATFFFNVGQYSSMRTAIGDAISHRVAGDEIVRCRVSMIVASVGLVIGNLDSANRWYSEAHSSAVAMGDQAAIGAIIYNRAALRVHSLRVNHALLALDGPSPAYKMAMAEVESAMNYQATVQLSSLNYLLFIAKAGALILGRQLSEAATLIQEILGTTSLSLTPRERVLLEVDNLVIAASMGEPSELLSFASDPNNEVRLQKCDPEEQFVAWTLIHQALSQCAGATSVVVSRLEERRNHARVAAEQEREQLAWAIEPYSTPTW